MKEKEEIIMVIGDVEFTTAERRKNGRLYIAGRIGKERWFAAMPVDETEDSISFEGLGLDDHLDNDEWAYEFIKFIKSLGPMI